MHRRIGTVLGAALLSLTATTGAFATSCGTVASPTSCSLNINGNTLFTLSNFFLGNSTGAIPYQAGDIAIDLSSGGGTLALLTLSKNPNGPTGGSAFAVGAGQASGFIMTFNTAISALQPGTVAFTGAQVSILESHSGTGFGSLQLTNFSLTACQATTGLGFNPVTCNINPALGTTVNGGGNIMSMNGNTAGSVSFTALQSQFDTSFTSSGVPEPTTFAMLGLGLAAVAIRRRK